MTQVADIADWCRSNYSPDGIEVASLGSRSLTLKVPADLPLTEICAELWNRFGATLELRQSSNANSATIIVWQSQADGADAVCSGDQELAAHRRRQHASQIGLVSVVAAAVLGCFVQYGAKTIFADNATLPIPLHHFLAWGRRFF